MMTISELNWSCVLLSNTVLYLWIHDGVGGSFIRTWWPLVSVKLWSLFTIHASSIGMRGLKNVSSMTTKCRHIALLPRITGVFIQRTVSVYQIPSHLKDAFVAQLKITSESGWKNNNLLINHGKNTLKINWLFTYK